MEWSKLQLAVFNETKTTNRNIVIKATAGSSKSTVLVQCSKIIPKYKRSLFLAFNKSISDELKNKLPINIECSTLHSLGLKILTKSYGHRIKVNQWKTLNHISKNLDKWKIAPDKRNYYQFNIYNLVNMCRLLMADRDLDAVKEVANRFDIEAFDKQATHALEVLAELDKYNANPYTHSVFLVDFTDMLELPYKLNLIKREYDVVMVDECQDNSLLQQKLILGLVKEKGRFIVVGDTYQSIYSFLGADVNSFNNFLSQPNTVELPLSISYRCAKSIVKKCQEINEEIQAWENSPEGEERYGSIKEIKPGDFVLCRNNKPLLSLYFDLLSKGIKSYIKGKDYGSGLLKMLESIKTKDRIEVFEALDEHLKYMEEKLREKGIDKPKLHPNYRGFKEKVEILTIIINNTGSPAKAYEQLDKIFKDDGLGIMLSTIHKAKGLEADRIFLIRRDLIPSKYATQEWSMTQERNLLFVAYSRAKKSLIYVNDWTDEKNKKESSDDEEHEDIASLAMDAQDIDPTMEEIEEIIEWRDKI